VRVLSLASISMLALLPAAHATNFFSDNFDTNPGQSSISSGLIDSSATGSFTVTLGSVDILGPSFNPSLCNTAPESGSCVDMDGSTAGQITSTPFALGIGNYTFRFNLFGSERGFPASTTVTLGPGGSLYNQTFNTVSGDQNIVNINFSVGAPLVGVTIVFSSNDGNSPAGTIIDNVSVDDVAPEPASALLMSMVIPLLWFGRRYCR
jgi:hypothetical protein